MVRLQGVLTAAEQYLAKTLPSETGWGLLKQVRTQLIEAARPVLEKVDKIGCDSPGESAMKSARRSTAACGPPWFQKCRNDSGFFRSNPDRNGRCRSRFDRCDQRYLGCVKLAACVTFMRAGFLL